MEGMQVFSLLVACLRCPKELDIKYIWTFGDFMRCLRFGDLFSPFISLFPDLLSLKKRLII